MRWRFRSVPGAMLSVAATLALAYAGAEVLGFREAATVLSGTFVSDNHTWDGLRCAAYVLLHFGFVAACPVLVVGAPIYWLLDRHVPGRGRAGVDPFRGARRTPHFYRGVRTRLDGDAERAVHELERAVLSGDATIPEWHAAHRIASSRR